MLNEKNITKSVLKKFRHCLGWSIRIHHYSFDCMLTGRGDRLWNEPF